LDLSPLRLLKQNYQNRDIRRRPRKCSESPTSSRISAWVRKVHGNPYSHKRKTCKLLQLYGLGVFGWGYTTYWGSLLHGMWTYTGETIRRCVTLPLLILKGNIKL